MSTQQVRDSDPQAGPEFSARGPVLLCTLVLIFLLCGFGAWAGFATLSGAVIAPGLVSVQDNRIPIQHVNGGVIRDIGAREGARVAAGEVLMRLDDDTLTAARRIVLDQLLELHARAARLRAERDNAHEVTFPSELRDLLENESAAHGLIDAQTRLFDARRATLDQIARQSAQRIAQIDAHRTGLRGQHTALLRQHALISEQIAIQQTLQDQGLARRAPLLALMSDEAHLEGRIAALDADLAAALERALELRQSQDMLQLQRREDAESALQDIAPRMIELETQRTSLDAEIASMELRAPVAGIVHGLTHTNPGAVLRPAEIALSVVPLDRPLLVIARLAPDRLDKVHKGQAARLLPASADMRDASAVQGEVMQISADAFEDSQSGAPYFRVEIAITDPPETAATMGMLPGMPVEVFMATSERSPISYLLAPLHRFLAHALREG